MIFALLAAIILSRQPNNLIGWLVMMPAVLGLFPAEAYIRSFTSAPANPPLLLLLAFWFYNWSWLLLIFPIFFIPVLFPTGKPLSPRSALVDHHRFSDVRPDRIFGHLHPAFYGQRI